MLINQALRFPFTSLPSSKNGTDAPASEVEIVTPNPPLSVKLADTRDEEKSASELPYGTALDKSIVPEIKPVGVHPEVQEVKGFPV